MKILPLLLPGLLLVACGGGGGGDGNNGGDGGPNLQEQAALAVLESCLAAPVDTFRDLIATVRAFPGSPNPPIQIADPNGNEIPFNADPSAGAPIPEALGVFTFRDPAGTAIMPFTAMELANDVGNLIEGIANLPDGTDVGITVFAIPAVGLEAGSMVQTMQGGIATEINGFFRTVEDQCNVDLSFSGETILSLLGIYPNLTADLEITRDTDALSGKVFFNGSNLAVVEVTINGTGPFPFQLDLDTGTVTTPP